ncbi:uncharacterized protein NPIL_273851 [Nephila pilipes]|uniref:Uncharacterized protein n=1 Tax=Nephila pilipes TaxID=299642 RepID=A0A8X6Q4X3_NEPPI|nr:uncharacterized protein NPIL_273851 [Nephila pilipes]
MSELPNSWTKDLPSSNSNLNAIEKKDRESKKAFAYCRSCGRNHAGEFFQHTPPSETDRDILGNLFLSDNTHCWSCRLSEEAKNDFLRDCGKGLSDCRFKKYPLSFPCYHRLIPRYGPAADFDLPIHFWNCKGHTHCKHGQTGTIEERAMTFQRDSTVGYMKRPNVCCGTVWSI